MKFNLLIDTFHATGLLYPWKHEKTRGCLIFPGGIERDCGMNISQFHPQFVWPVFLYPFYHIATRQRDGNFDVIIQKRIKITVLVIDRQQKISQCFKCSIFYKCHKFSISNLEMFNIS